MQTDERFGVPSSQLRLLHWLLRHNPGHSKARRKNDPPETESKLEPLLVATKEIVEMFEDIAKKPLGHVSSDVSSKVQELMLRAIARIQRLAASRDGPVHVTAENQVRRLRALGLDTTKSVVAMEHPPSSVFRRGWWTLMKRACGRQRGGMIRAAVVLVVFVVLFSLVHWYTGSTWVQSGSSGAGKFANYRALTMDTDRALTIKTIAELDAIAKKFLKEDFSDKHLAAAKRLAEGVYKRNKKAPMYVKIMETIKENGLGYIESETIRVSKLLEGQMIAAKFEDMSYKLQILGVFAAKDEL